jgi:hypothetical protein
MSGRHGPVPLEAEAAGDARPLTDVWLCPAPIDPRLGRLEFNDNLCGRIQFSNCFAQIPIPIPIPILFPENGGRDEIDVALPLNE